MDRTTDGADEGGARVAPRVGAGLALVRVLAPLGALVMTVVVVDALASGAALGADGAAIAAIVWGRVTLVDLALALPFGWGWIAWREASWPRAVAWLVLVTVTGSIALFGYLAGAAWRNPDGLAVVVGPRRAAHAGH
jgi:hypothetical protein